MREAIRRPYCCDTCGKRFKQLQGLNRHYREKHAPRLCLFCDVAWSRPYQYRDHLKTHHPDVDPDTVISKTASDDGDFVELLPELQKLIYSGSEDEFTSFIDTSQNAGRPVTLVHLGVGPPPDMREAIRRPYCCDTCGKRFSQLQGINRHYREKHDPRLCLFCDVEWSRPYQYRDHLKTHHPDVDPDTGIGKTAGSRRGSQVLQETRYNIKFCLRTLRVLGRAQSGILDYIRLDGARGRASRRCSLLLDCAVN